MGRRPLDFAGGFAALERVAEEFAGWAPELTALLTDGETAPVARVLRALPDERRWERVPGVTLPGDAAHLMPPSGEGANLAVLDAAELGEALAAHPGDVERPRRVRGETLPAQRPGRRRSRRTARPLPR